MNNKWKLISSIILLAVGVLAVAAFAVIAFVGEDVGKWIATLIVAVIFIIDGIVGIRGYFKKN